MRQASVTMEDRMTSTEDEEVVPREPPGYMRSTLTTPGPCARPSTGRRPYSAPAYTELEGPESSHIQAPAAMGPGERKDKPPRGARVGVAGFYDWSPGLTIQKCSSPRGKVEPQSPRAVSQVAPGVRGGRIRQWGGPGLQSGSGRMFVKEKGFLTKGEREIISGIVHNRRHLLDRSAERVLHDGFHSHRDAWLVGKPCVSQRNCCSARSISYSSDRTRGNRGDEQGMDIIQKYASKAGYCLQCLEQSRLAEQDEPLAPPSTPEQLRRTISLKPAKVPPIGLDFNQGAIYVRKAHVQDRYSVLPVKTPDVGGQKTVVDVYLPRLPRLDKLDGDCEGDSGLSYDDSSSEAEPSPGLGGDRGPGTTATCSVRDFSASPRNSRYPSTRPGSSARRKTPSTSDMYSSETSFYTSRIRQMTFANPSRPGSVNIANRYTVR